MAKQGKNTRKHSRGKRKTAGRNNPLSLYIRGLITAEQYLKQTGQKSGK